MKESKINLLKSSVKGNMEGFLPKSQGKYLAAAARSHIISHSIR